MAATIIVIAIVVIIIGYGISIYNSIAKSEIKVDEGYSTIDVYLKKRYDLIPNLVSTVKGYAKHESETLTKVIEARNLAINSKDIGEIENANSIISKALPSIFALAENYPNLKANDNFMSLQGELANIEGELSNARRYYNGCVREFNTKIITFPNILIANIFGKTKKEFFEADKGERENIKIEF